MATKKTEHQPYERSSKLGIKDIVWNNFIGGMFWALGATLGLAIIFTVLTLLAKNISLVPLVGNFVSEVINFIMNNNPNVGQPPK